MTPPTFRLTFRMPMREAMMPTIEAIAWNETENCSFEFGKNICNGGLPDPEEEAEHFTPDAGLIP